MAQNVLSRRVTAVAASAFVRGSFVYLSGNVVNAILPLLLLPVLTRYLTPTDYGFVATSVVLVQVIATTIGLNTSGLIVQSQFADDFGTRRRLVSTNLLVACALAAALTLMWLPAGAFVETVTKFPSKWIPLVIVVALTGVIQSIYLCIVQSRNEARLFVSLQILGNVLNLGVSLVLVVVVGMNWRGRMIAMLISGLVITVICLHGLASRLQLLRGEFDRTAMRSLLSFGIPLIPHVAGGWVMTMAPRLYLNNLATVADTGLFGVGYNLASPIALVVGATNQAYLPTLFSRLEGLTPAGRLRLARMLLLAAAALPLSAMLYTLGVRFVVPWIVGPNFLKVTDYVMWFALAFALQGVYFIFANFVVYSKRTSLIAWRGDFAGGLTVLVGCPLLIHLNGPVGAAQAALLGLAVSCTGAFMASRKAYPMPWGRAARSLIGWHHADPIRDGAALSGEGRTDR